MALKLPTAFDRDAVSAPSSVGRRLRSPGVAPWLVVTLLVSRVLAPHRASARPREESRVAESLPARRATDRPNEDVTARARSRDETPRSAVFSRGVASPALAPRLLARTHRLSINSAPDRSPGAPGRRRRRPSRVVVVAGGCVDRAGDLGGRQSSARESARANAGEIDDARVDRRTRDEGGRLARGGATRRRGTISNDF